MAASALQISRTWSFAAGTCAAAILMKNQLDRQLMNGRDARKYLEDLAVPLRGVLGDLGLLK